MASDISDRLAGGATGSREVQAKQVIGLANEGELVVGAQPHRPRGHTVTARPRALGLGSFTSVEAIEDRSGQRMLRLKSGQRKMASLTVCTAGEWIQWSV